MDRTCGDHPVTHTTTLVAKACPDAVTVDTCQTTGGLRNIVLLRPASVGSPLLEPCTAHTAAPSSAHWCTLSARSCRMRRVRFRCAHINNQGIVYCFTAVHSRHVADVTNVESSAGTQPSGRSAAAAIDPLQPPARCRRCSPPGWRRWLRCCLRRHIVSRRPSVRFVL